MWKRRCMERSRQGRTGPDPIQDRSRRSLGIVGTSLGRVWRFGELCMLPAMRSVPSGPHPQTEDCYGRPRGCRLARTPQCWKISMTIDELIFIGLNGYALALNRDTGEIVWSNNNLESGPVTMLLDGD